MIFLKPTTNSQNIQFIPRVYSATRLVLRNEITNQETEITGTFTQIEYYLTASLIFDLKEGQFYNLTVYNVNDIVYKDKVFCTSQTPLSYSINKDEYVSNSTNNDFIIL